MEKHKPRKKKIVAVSGGFDPLHVGHIRLFREAKKLGDTLVVIVNNDNWMRKKKGFSFMSAQERKELIGAIEGVDKVMISSHPKNPKDMSVSRDLLRLRPALFANGGDRDEKDAANPESSLYKDIQVCKKCGIEIIFNVGKGGKVQSSSWLLAAYAHHAGTRKKRKE